MTRASFFIALFCLIVGVAIALTSLLSPRAVTFFQNIGSPKSVVNSLAALPIVGDVLGSWWGGRSGYVPRIIISGTKEGYAAGGVIPLSSMDEPSILIEGNDISGTADVSVYEANEDALFTYLTHDQEWKQTKRNFDVNTFTFITTLKHTILPRGNEDSRLLLPIGESGIWFVRVKLGNISQDGFVVRSNNGVLVKEGNNELIFWAQNYKTKRSVKDGQLKLYALRDEKKELGSVSFDSDGLARFPTDPDIDVAVASFDSDKVLIPINLLYLNTGNYAQFRRKSANSKYFVFTDRPIYRPGDTVFYKAVIRNDDDARYSIPQGTAVVKVYKDWDEKKAFYDKNIPISGSGTVFGQMEIPKDSNPGYYSLSVKIAGQTDSQGMTEPGDWAQNTIGFQVENFRKPEYSIDISIPKQEYISGDPIPVTFSGSYFSGHALSAASVHYTVTSSDYYDYEYIMDKQFSSRTDEYRYGGWYGKQIKKETVVLDSNGSNTTNLLVDNSVTESRLKVISIEAQYTDGSGNPSYARKNILIYPGLFGIYRKEYGGWSVITGSQAKLPISLMSYGATDDISSIALVAKVHRENWISFQENGKKYPSYRKETEDLPPINAVTDSKGNAEFRFVPQKSGSYKLTVSGKDAKGNSIEKDFYIWVSSTEQPYYNDQYSAGISVQGDRGKYNPGERAIISVQSDIPDRDILLSIDRARVNRLQIVRMTGKSTLVDVPIVQTDIPNIFITASSFSPRGLDSASIDVKINSDSKQVVVKLSPNRETYAPGDTAVVNVETTDVGGNPISADTAVWAIDKALLELVDENQEKIFARFWTDRYNNTQTSHSLLGINVYGAEGGGGCFAAGTPVLMADGTFKSIEKIKKGDTILTRKNETDTALAVATVAGTESIDETGFLIINTKLKVTANHKMFVNGTWKEAGDIQVGDTLSGVNGFSIPVTSIEWQSVKIPVYNLEVDTYHTFFAGGVWVHNQKGGGSRSIFKDTAYWNPAVHTGSDGRAQISFKLPDNLTTWVISSIGSTTDTRVGQSKKDIIVTKEVIVRPILPNILRIGDTLRLSALVHNHTAIDRVFTMSLGFDSGKVTDSVKNGIQILKNNLTQVYWDVVTNKENNSAKITIAAKGADGKNVGDSIVSEIPVLKFGFFESHAFTGDGQKEFPISVQKDSDRAKSTISVLLAPSQFGLLPQAMEYLIGYPYGCVEQTTSSFVPSVIARNNLDLFGDIQKAKNLDDILNKGIKRLALLQKSDGGWTWWYSGNSDVYITSYVVEYLTLAAKSGINVDNSMMERAKSFLENETQFDPITNPGNDASYRDDRIIKTYILSLLGSAKGKNQVAYFSTRSVDIDPDILSMAVMVNVKNGNKDPQTNGLSLLLSMMKSQGDSVYWPAARNTRFGSIDASTAFAIRAIIAGGGDRTIAVKAARYLVQNRKNQYWSNTYATAQVVRSIVELVRSGNEATPNYSFSVTLDGNVISRGSVNSLKQTIAEITIPVSKIKTEGSVIAVNKTGEGQLYSTVIQKEFRTDSSAKAVSKGLSITREYENDKGSEYSIGVGDTVRVKLTVSGLSTDQNYALIEDELPSGLIPINTKLNNELYGTNNSHYYTSYDASDMEVTQNGMQMSLYRIGTSPHTYIYKARAIADGQFLAPPASVILMYSPEIYARSTSDVVKISPASEIIPAALIKKTVESQIKSFRIDYRSIGYFLIGIASGGLILFIFRNKLFKRRSVRTPDHEKNQPELPTKK